MIWSVIPLAMAKPLNRNPVADRLGRPRVQRRPIATALPSSSNVAPLDTVVLLATPSAETTSAAPLLMKVEDACPPDCTIRSPRWTSVSSAWAPEDTTTVPPARRVPSMTPPARTPWMAPLETIAEVSEPWTLSTPPFETVVSDGLAAGGNLQREAAADHEAGDRVAGTDLLDCARREGRCAAQNRATQQLERAARQHGWCHWRCRPGRR